jgi:hypothetical protein
MRNPKMSAVKRSSYRSLSDAGEVAMRVCTGAADPAAGMELSRATGSNHLLIKVVHYRSIGRQDSGATWHGNDGTT